VTHSGGLRALWFFHIDPMIPVSGNDNSFLDQLEVDLLTPARKSVNRGAADYTVWFAGAAIRVAKSRVMPEL
jgi:hypothetical protein